MRDAIRICDYFDRPLVLVAWFSKCGGHCEPVLDAVERIRRRFPDVAFVGVDIRNSPDEARDAVEENGWGFPMAVDRDGAVGLLYSVGVGPTIFFAYPGGVLAAKALGELTEEELIDRVERLQRTSRKRQNGARIKNPDGTLGRAATRLDRTLAAGGVQRTCVGAVPRLRRSHGAARGA